MSGNTLTRLGPLAARHGSAWALALAASAAWAVPDPSDDPLGQLQTVAIFADRLVIEDWKLNQRWVVPEAQIGFQRGEGHVYGSLAGALDWRDRRVDLKVDADYTVAERVARVTLHFANVEPSDFADVVPELEPLDYISAPLSGSLTLTVNETGEKLGLNFDLGVGEGQINVPDMLSQSLALKDGKRCRRRARAAACRCS